MQVLSRLIELMQLLIMTYFLSSLLIPGWYQEIILSRFTYAKFLVAQLN